MSQTISEKVLELIELDDKLLRSSKRKGTKLLKAGFIALNVFSGFSIATMIFLTLRAFQMRLTDSTPFGTTQFLAAVFLITALIVILWAPFFIYASRLGRQRLKDYKRIREGIMPELKRKP